MLKKSTTLLDLMELWTIGRQSPYNPQLKATSLEYLQYMLDQGLTSSIKAVIDKDRLALRILSECGTLKPVYNTTDVFYTMAVAWWKTRAEQIEHLIASLLTQYEPFEEFRWHETEVLDGLKKTDDTRTIDRDTTISNEGEYHNTGHTDDLTETGVSADNESSFQPREHVEKTVDDTLGNRHEDATTDNEDKTDTLDGRLKTDDTTNRDFYGHKKSNMELALEELEVAQHNVYDIIVKWFTDAMFVGIWE